MQDRIERPRNFAAVLFGRAACAPPSPAAVSAHRLPRCTSLSPGTSLASARIHGAAHPPIGGRGAGAALLGSTGSERRGALGAPRSRHVFGGVRARRCAPCPPGRRPVPHPARGTSPAPRVGERPHALSRAQHPAASPAPPGRVWACARGISAEPQRQESAPALGAGPSAERAELNSTQPLTRAGEAVAPRVLEVRGPRAARPPRTGTARPRLRQ